MSVDKGVCLDMKDVSKKSRWFLRFLAWTEWDMVIPTRIGNTAEGTNWFLVRLGEEGRLTHIEFKEL